MNTGPKKLPTLRDSKDPAQVDVFQREVRELFRRLWAELGQSSDDVDAVTLPIAESDVTGLVSDLAGKSSVGHTHAESDVTGLVSDLAAKVPTTRTISTTSPLSGGGDLSANRTIVVADNSTGSKGVVAIAPNDTTKFYRGDATWAVVPAYLSGHFGQTNDGALTFDGSTVILGITPAAATIDGTSYNQYTLTRDIFCTTFTINSGAAVKEDGYRVYAITSTINGILHNNGGDASGAAAGTGAPNRVLGGGTNAGTSGGTGGNGTATTSSPLGLFSTDTSALGTSGAAGSTASAPGRGGGGGGQSNATPGASAGGTGGGTTITTATTGGADITSILAGSRTTTGIQWLAGTGGGGGGQFAGGGSTATGGKGGGGAGFLTLCTRTLGGTGKISANGGDSLTAGAVTGTNAACGGGGGGGGGVVLVVYATRTGSLTIEAVGGTGSAGAAVGGGNTGYAGANGSDGKVVLCNTSGDNT